MIFRLVFAAALLTLLGASPVRAVEPAERLVDPALEARARTLSKELRCLVCQNQSIDDSNAELAHDLRGLLRQRLALGDSDRQILDGPTETWEAVIARRHSSFVWMAAGCFCN